MDNFTRKQRREKYVLLFGEKVMAWTERSLDETGSKKKLSTIESDLGMAKGRLSKLTAQATPPTLDEIVVLAKAMGITCDELITGIAPENQALHQETGLSNSTIKWLSWAQSTYPDYIKMLNILFEDNHNVSAAQELLDALLLYANDALFSVHIGEMEKGFPLPLSSDMRVELAKGISLNYLSKVLEYTHSNWSDIIGTRVDVEIQKRLGDMVIRLDENAKHIDTVLDEEQSWDADLSDLES